MCGRIGIEKSRQVEEREGLSRTNGQDRKDEGRTCLCASTIPRRSQTPSPRHPVPEPPPALVSSNLRAKQEKALKPLASKFSVSKIATVGKNSTTGNSPALANALSRGEQKETAVLAKGDNP